MFEPLKKTLVASLFKLFASDDRFYLLDCDLGSVYGSDVIKSHFPNRYLQIGISEQNAIGIASGIASSGFIPIVVSLSCFITGRCFDQLRLNCALSNLPIVIIGLHAGSFLGPDGPTHQSPDDLSLISSLPNVRIFTPSTHSELSDEISLLSSAPQPTYIRLSFPPIDDQMQSSLLTQNFTPTKSPLIISYGYVYSLLYELFSDSPSLSLALISSSCHDYNHILDRIRSFHRLHPISKVISFEDSYFSGSLASLLYRAYIENSQFPLMKSFYLETNVGACGSVEDIVNHLRLSRDDIMNFISSSP